MTNGRRKKGVGPEVDSPAESHTPEQAAPEVTEPPDPDPVLTDEEAAILKQEGQAALFEMGESIPDKPEPFGDGPVPSDKETGQTAIPGMGENGPAPGEVVVDFSKINEIMAQRRAAERAAIEQEAADTPEKPGAERPAEEAVADPPKRRGRPSKAEKAEPEQATDKPRRGRRPKAEKEQAAPEEKSRTHPNGPSETNWSC